MLKWLLLLLAFAPAAASAAPPPVTVTTISWHGWPQAVKLSNGIVEAVVVAAGSGASWRLSSLDTPKPTRCTKTRTGLPAKNRLPKPGEWANYGGDKVWPAPQSDWPRLIGP